MKKILQSLRTEDWVIVLAGGIIVTLATLFPNVMPQMPKSIDSLASIRSGLMVYILLTSITLISNKLIGRKSSGTTLSLFAIFIIALSGQLLAQIPEFKLWSLEPVFFAVILGLIISNTVGVPEWLKPAIQSEFYIKIGIICLGSTILFGDVMASGAYGMLQSLIVVFTVWNFTFWLARKLEIDREMGTMLSSAVSICGVSAAIATCGVIKGDNKKLSYVISLVLVCAIPMMYIMPIIANYLGLNQEVAGAWLGGTIDTTGAVAASGEMIDATAAQTAIIVKSSQNILLGVAAFAISLMWIFNGGAQQDQERPTLALIWSRFPKFVVGFVCTSLIFSLLPTDIAKNTGSITKSLTTALFSIAFVCIGLETRFKDLFTHENRKPLVLFLTAQSFNIMFTLAVAYLIFGILKPMIG